MYRNVLYYVFNPKAEFRKIRGQILPFFLPQRRIFPEVLYRTVFDELIHVSHNEKINVLHTFILFKHLAKHFETSITDLVSRSIKLPLMAN